MARLAELWPPFRQRWVVFEDEALLVVDKPAGVPVYPGAEAGLDLKSRLVAWLQARDGTRPKLWLLHGLDREASGLVVVSKRKAVNGALAAQLNEGVARRFVAATAAEPKGDGGAQRNTGPQSRGAQSRGAQSRGAQRSKEQNAEQRRGRDRSRKQHDRRKGKRAYDQQGQYQQQGRPGRSRRSGKRPPRDAASPPPFETLQQQPPRRLLAIAVRRSGGKLRARLAAAGAPIAGDRDHGGPPAGRLMLHHQDMQLRHPQDDRQLMLHAPRPTCFDDWLGSVDPNALPDDIDALHSKLMQAAERRYALACCSDHDVFRVVHGAGDGLPGVELDRYGDFAVLRLHERIDEPTRARLIEAIAQMGFAGVYLKVRPRQASVIADTRQRQWAPNAPVAGSAAPSPLLVHESGVRYRAYLADGLSTGLFLDQRDNRARLRQLSQGKRVLNLFAYHGAFTVAAIAGGATSTVTLDSSQAALDRAAQNLALHHATGAQHEWVCADALRWLERAAERKRRFDVIVLDPPSYATTKTSRFSVKRDYLALATRCLTLLDAGGTLLACTNHRGTDLKTFERWLRTAAHNADRRIIQFETLPCPLDHPPSPTAGCHLKSALLQL